MTKEKTTSKTKSKSKATTIKFKEDPSIDRRRYYIDYKETTGIKFHDRLLQYSRDKETYEDLLEKLETERDNTITVSTPTGVLSFSIKDKKPRKK